MKKLVTVIFLFLKLLFLSVSTELVTILSRNENVVSNLDHRSLVILTYQDVGISC